MSKIKFRIKSNYLKAQIQMSILGFRIQHGYFKTKTSKPFRSLFE